MFYFLHYRKRDHVTYILLVRTNRQANEQINRQTDRQKTMMSIYRYVDDGVITNRQSTKKVTIIVYLSTCRVCRWVRARRCFSETTLTRIHSWTNPVHCHHLHHHSINCRPTDCCPRLDCCYYHLHLLPSQGCRWYCHPSHHHCCHLSLKQKVRFLSGQVVRLSPRKGDRLGLRYLGWRLSLLLLAARWRRRRYLVAH